MHLSTMTVEYLDQISLSSSMMTDLPSPLFSPQFKDTPEDPKLHVIEAQGNRPRVIFRQVRLACDTLYEMPI